MIVRKTMARLKQIKAKMEQTDNILIGEHVNPDGDKIRVGKRRN